MLILGGCGASSPSSPTIPPQKPANAFTCEGHRNRYCVPFSNINDSVWYAYWSETPDSTHAELLVGIGPKDQTDIQLVQGFRNPNPSFTDTTIFGWWRYSGNDMSVTDWEFVQVSQDSVIIGSHGVDCGEYYYLKKLP